MHVTNSSLFFYTWGEKNALSNIRLNKNLLAMNVALNRTLEKDKKKTSHDLP